MDRKCFAELVNASPEEIDDFLDMPKAFDRLLEKSLALDKPEEKLQVAIEELAELAKEISKFLRKKGNHYGLLEEMADVYITLAIVQRIYGISSDEINRAMIVKLREYIAYREGQIA